MVIHGAIGRMDAKVAAYSKVIFLVGLGSSADLYSELLHNLHEQFPQAEFSIIEWWKHPDFGMGDLKVKLQNSNAILIGHSGGGMLALKAFAEWPGQVQRIIMLDSHIIHQISKLPSVDQMLTIMLAGDSPGVKQQIENAYASVKKDDTQFYQAFTYVVAWVNSDFERVAMNINKMPPHFVLHVGFTDSNYKTLGSAAMTTENELWGKYGMDVTCMPMNHFDLVDSSRAMALSRLISVWLYR
jgi:pimeloyl-ACP methyl ester carboxylesterase